MNLLTHIEDIQNQLSGRMDLIEKELDGKVNETKNPKMRFFECILVLLSLSFSV